MKKKYILPAVCAALVFLAGLFLYQQQPVVLTLGVFAGSAWDVPSSRSYEILDCAIEKFEAENPGVEVTYTSGIVKDDYSDTLADWLVEGNSPDVFMILPEDFDRLCEADALKPLDHLLEEDQISQNDFYASALGFGQYQDIQYALPFESNVDLLFVNTTLLEKEGIELKDSLDLEEFYQICSQVTKDLDGDGLSDQFGICDYTWKQAADAMGIQLFDENGTRVSLSNNKVKEVLNYTRKLNALSKEAELLKTSDQEDPFSEGRAAFAVMSFADYRTYTPYPWKIKRLSSFEWTVLPLPAQSEAIAEVQTIEMAVSSRTNYPQKSWELLKTLCLDPEIQTMHYTCSQGISALKGTDKPAREDSEVDYSILDQVMTHPVRQARFSNYENALEALSQEMEKILSSSANDDILLMQAESKINRFLNS